MTATWSVEIPGEPVATGRPRTRVVKPAGRAAFSHTYTPARTRNAKAYLREYISARCPAEPLQGALFVTVTVVLVPPKSRPKWWHEAVESGAVWPTSKPDVDNLAKTILDASNGIVWRDDAQIVDLHVRKAYGRPRTVLEVGERWQPGTAKEWREMVA